jgi:endonuclease V-like protein UPF0215 family
LIEFIRILSSLHATVSSLRSKSQVKGPIREVKTEIRVMGLWAAFVRRGYTEFIGVVFRGSLYIDGVLRRRIRNWDGEAIKRLAKSIRASPHFGQLRVIIIQDSPEMRKANIEAESLHELTGLPVIALSEDAMVFRAYGLDSSTASNILRRIQGPEGLPEALKVAKIFAEAMVACRTREKAQKRSTQAG